MKPTLDELILEYEKLLNSQVFNRSELDYSIIDYHVRLLECIDAVDSGCASIFDLCQRKHVYYSPKYENVLGWDAERAKTDITYTNNLIHPDDLPEMYRAAVCYIKLGFALADRTTSRDYSTIFDYRVKGKEGTWVRIIEQQVPLEFDRNGNVWLAMSMVDLSPDHDIEIPFRGRLKNLRTGEFFYFPPEESTELQAAYLTNREKEILQWIARGLISKQIADKLYISVNTVNTHRQRIIEKLNVSNTYEAIRYAHERGIIG